MTKTLNHIFFFLHQHQNIFFNNIGYQNIILEKKHNPPPLQVKWPFPYDFVPNRQNRGEFLRHFMTVSKACCQALKHFNNVFATGENNVGYRRHFH
jgi:hypothetical protein